MTPSEKPERSDSQPKQDANQSSVITQTANGDETGSAASAGQEHSTAETAEADSTETSSGHGGEALDGTETPPPWQRGSTTASTGSASTPDRESADGESATAGASAATRTPDAEDTQTIPKPTPPEADTVRTERPGSGGQDGRTTVSFTGSGGAQQSSANTGSRRPSRGPRRASLQIKRVDPWSVLKLALVLSVAMFFVWMIAVAVLYGVLDGMGVWEQLNGTFTELTSPEDATSDPLISAGRVFGVAMIIGAINIVLFTALATVSAFIYNVAADFAGGAELTLSERE